MSHIFGYWPVNLSTVIIAGSCVPVICGATKCLSETAIATDNRSRPGAEHAQQHVLSKDVQDPD